ncbi:MAG: hypothetical protein AB2L11_11400 [Syntrophobacteraceae bacterium]
MSELSKKRAVYEDLFEIPANMTGEIIDGELIVTPRPSRKRTVVTSRPTPGIACLADRSDP